MNTTSNRLVIQKRISQSAFFNLRILLALVAFFVWVLSMLGDVQAPTSTSGRTLTFAEHVAYQRVIEDVYWRHRIWPQERPAPKPSLDAVMSQAQLEKKVVDYLRNCQALEDYWQRPLTAEQLQAEMDRMAKHTKQPEVLRELFEALGNDPFVIAECLARPALADRLLTSWFAYDERIHGDLKERAEAELQAHPGVEQMKQLSGKYSEFEFIRSDSTQDKDGSASPEVGGKATRQRTGNTHAVKLNDSEWADSVQKLAATFDLAESQSITGRDPAIAGGRSSLSERLGVTLNQTVPMGKLSPLREDETTYHATAVIEKSNDHLKLATVSWRKAPLESWLATAESQVRDAMAVPRASYTLTEIPSGGCIDDTWRATSGPPDGREGHTAVWTGSEMIIWGGEIYTLAIYGSGGRYNPSTDTWTVTSNINAPTARALHTAVWSGSEMIVWGGLDQNHFDLNTGGKYNPQTDSWVTTAIANAPEARDSHTAVWTGNEMIAWGGGGYLNTGGSYNPDLNVWTVTSTVNAPS